VTSDRQQLELYINTCDLKMILKSQVVMEYDFFWIESGIDLLEVLCASFCLSSVYETTYQDRKATPVSIGIKSTVTIGEDDICKKKVYTVYVK